MKLVSFLIIICLYFVLSQTNYNIFYPLSLFVAFLHELGHSMFSIITWWNVISLDINANWSGLATTSGWFRSLVIMWWYIGSALFGSLLLFSSVKFERFTNYILRFFSLVLLYSSIFWFSDITSSLIQIVLSISLFWISYINVKYSSFFLQLIWVFSLIYIIKDFNVWPSSDLSKFSWLLPVIVWQYIWLGIVLVIFSITIKYTYFSSKSEKNDVYKIVLKK